MNKSIADNKVSLIYDKFEYCKDAPYHPSEMYPEVRNKEISKSDNPVYRSVRNLFHLMGYDKENYGTIQWNPMSEIIRKGDKVILKPNWVAHKNFGQRVYNEIDTDCLITHSSVIRVVLDYVAKALDNEGEIIIGDAPIQVADWIKILELTNMQGIVDYFKREFPSIKIEVLDFRLDKTTLFSDGSIKEQVFEDFRKADYFEVDIGDKSSLMPLIERKCKLGSPDYSEYKMKYAHNAERNLYLLPKNVLNADVVINLPKMKTHRKAGITCAMKNFVGINGYKDYIAHFSYGSPANNGDEYPNTSLDFKLLWFLVHCNWNSEKVWAKKLFTILWSKYASFLRRTKKLPLDFMNSGGGSWYGNDTVWRTLLDINRCFFYFNKDENRINEKSNSINYLAIVDGIVVGHKESPISPSPKKAGVMLVSRNPLAIDTVVCALFGFDINKVKQITEGYKLKELKISSFNAEEINIITSEGIINIDDIYLNEKDLKIEPSKGFKGHIEYEIKK